MHLELVDPYWMTPTLFQVRFLPCSQSGSRKTGPELYFKGIVRKQDPRTGTKGLIRSWGCLSVAFRSPSLGLCLLAAPLVSVLLPQPCSLLLTDTVLFHGSRSRMKIIPWFYQGLFPFSVYAPPQTWALDLATGTSPGGSLLCIIIAPTPDTLLQKLLHWVRRYGEDEEVDFVDCGPRITAFAFS